MVLINSFAHTVTQFHQGSPVCLLPAPVLPRLTPVPTPADTSAARPASVALPLSLPLPLIYFGHHFHHVLHSGLFCTSPLYKHLTT